MTCEVAVMNRRGIAVAADSAVTLGDSKKIYHTAEKLFSISPSVPVAIMTFGCADMMDAPWETIVKMYAKTLDAATFARLDDYATSFLNFIQDSTALFPPQKQAECVQRSAYQVWSTYRGELERAIEHGSHGTVGQRNAALAAIINDDHKIFQKYADLPGVGSDHGAHVAKLYADQLEEVERSLFEGIALTPQLRFPSILQFDVATIAAGKLRYIKRREARIGIDCDASVVPFAQRETIDTIISGINPTLVGKLFEDVDRLAMPVKGRTDKRAAERVDWVKKDFEKYVCERYDDPFMSAVSGLPRQDLAKMAEALVSLTAFVIQMTADQEETVAEPVDVAILSKGDGFTWVKHKDLIREAGRLAL